MKTAPEAASVLVIGEDANVTAAIATELLEGGYRVRLARALADTIGSELPDPDLIILCGLAVVAHPRYRGVPVLRLHDGIQPEGVVAQVHRRIMLRAVLQVVEDAAA